MSTWTFYDSWRAFPLSRLREDDKSVVGELLVSLDHPDGGTEGEFVIRFYDHGERTGIGARLEVFGDAWVALASSGLVAELATLDDKQQTQADVTAVLLRLGYVDKTYELSGGRPVPCPTCRGRGYLE